MSTAIDIYIGVWTAAAFLWGLGILFAAGVAVWAGVFAIIALLAGERPW